MKPLRINARLRAVLLAGAAAGLLASCSTLNYYTQAAQGQLELLSDARPIDDWIADPGTSTKLRLRLETARQIRRFAVSEMALPDNNSYKNYTSLKRKYVLWNVVATPELSLKPLQWCFPVAGCVNYRGYYSKEAAESYARELKNEGDDVEVGGVPAYSTLGWFSDPLISTFINYPDAELARMIFHELAHQIVYAQGDSQFNESFASTVEEVGVERWMDRFGNQAMRDSYARYKSRKHDFLVLLLKYRKALEQNYALVDRSDSEKRAVKARLFQELKDEYQVLKGNWGGYAGYDRFFEQPLSNAHLASIATYEDFVPAFQAMLRRDGSFPRFYKSVRQLAELDRKDRHRILKALAPPVPAAPLMVQRSDVSRVGGH
ncbi:aminopeptidase [Massilia sp. WF1]|uniref:aminopeptidase n=1 Tax=unclassified Massilia TaxID=2609279 RepID=UPI00064B0399|nr:MULTISPECIES: aminopeptidase [unclassified Massilia]ALK99215.1 aminopeptidase [Massilia sp. WG5]KLU35065.1 aminopeptidase [Massilia sp. WF1]